MSREVRPRILMTTDVVGGVWTYSLDLAVGMLPQIGDVTFAIIGPPPSKAQREAAEEHGIQLIETGLPLDWSMAVERQDIRAAGAFLAQMARDLGAELLHLNAPIFAAGVEFAMPVIGTCHSCVATWWDAVRGGEKLPSEFQWRADMLAQAYRNCDLLIAPSAAFARATGERYGVQPVVVHNGRRAGEGDAPRKKPHALTAGRLWDAGKNLATLDRVAAALTQPVYAAGSLVGPQGEIVSCDHMICLGQLEAGELSARLERAAAFASLALYEPFGLGVLEAAQAGCALVLSDIPTFRELWSGAAILVPAFDDVEAARILDLLLSDPDECAAWGERARARAARYSQARMVEGTLAAYRSALASRRHCEAAA